MGPRGSARTATKRGAEAAGATNGICSPHLTRPGEGGNKLIFQQWQIVTMDESIGNFNMGKEQKEGSAEGGGGRQ